jgi:hypothetical protein
MRSLPAGFFSAIHAEHAPPAYPLSDAALKRPAKFSFATLAAAMISVVLRMNFQSQLRPAILRAQRSTRSLAMSSLSDPACHRNHAPFMPAAAIARINPIIRSG